ncbi:MAG: AI-2E family transporter [Bacteroidetes bacterium]|nr:AI-2E family transporter [Bacteroidota bacterium]
MESSSKTKFPIVSVVAVSAIALGYFLYLTGMALNPLIISGASFFLLFPFRKESVLIRKLLMLTIILFMAWILRELGMTLLPFAVAMMFAYLLDPAVSWLERKYIPRWIAALVIILCMVGGISLISIFVFPIAFAQLDDVLRQVSSMITSATSYLESRKFYRMLESFGLPRGTMKEIVQNEMMPKVESIYKVMLGALLSVLTSLSGIASQLLNVILIPILSFYFVKDFPKLREFLRRMVERNNKRVYTNLERMSDILKAYFGWQIIAAMMVGTLSSILFSLFGVPYPIVLGVLCGFFNPIPLFGAIVSMTIGIITVLLVNPSGAGGNIITIALVINGLHFFNAYVIEPRILGKRVGLHPIMLLVSLFVFGHFFGFLGLLIAVPTTAILMMFLRDWEKRQDTLMPIITDDGAKSEST